MALIDQTDIFYRVHPVHQHKMLMYHPDPQVHRLPGRSDFYLFAANEDLSGIRTVNAVDDIHQRALTGSVFAKQRMDFASFKREVYMVVRDVVTK